MTRFCRLSTRRNFLRLLPLAMIALVSGYYFRYEIENLVFKNYCAEPITKEANDAKNFGECRIPKINPFHPDAMALIKKYERPLNCIVKKRVTLSGGKLEIFGSDVVTASYKTVHRPKGDDFGWKLSDPITVEGKSARISHEFIELTLKLTNGDVVKEHLFQVLRRPELTKRQSRKSELGLNVVIFAMDSISNGHAQRKLPKSYGYIRDELEAYVFSGHSAVGDGTTEQLAAMLSGKGERQQPEARKGMPGAKVVDNWDWIFKKAKDNGYITSLLEDAPDVASFNYRLLGFKDPPTDFYPRPLLLAARDILNPACRHCYGSKIIHEYHFDLARQFYEKFPDKRKFLFHFTDLTHDEFNSAERIENVLVDFMKEFKNKGYLNDTLLIVMGDHGWRFGDFRQTVQGKLEERLPFFTMTLPRWFKQKYPQIHKNLKTNTQRLTSWYDVYATLNHLLTYPKEPQGLPHGRSLLNEIPAVRSCKDANIPSHWCPCLQWTAVDQQHNHVQQAVLETVRYINDLNSNEPLAAKHCTQLMLGEVKHSEVETPSNEVMMFFESGKDGYDPINSYNPGAKDQCNYQITFQTLPNNGIFEATVTFVEGQFRVKGSVSRINAYGDQPKCIATILPHLRKYCLCKSYT